MTRERSRQRGRHDPAGYNGWTDEREEEREALDQFQMTLTAAALRRRHLPGRVRRLLVRAVVREILARSAAARGRGRHPDRAGTAGQSGVSRTIICTNVLNRGGQ